MEQGRDVVAWGRTPGHEFCHRVNELARLFGWNREQRDWLMACMAFESGETFRSDIKNAAGSGATGLIQFMPATARGLGTTTEMLARMTPIQQLDYVASYFRPYAKKVHTLADMYMAILMPKYVGKPDSTPIFSGGVAYRQNSGLDANKDGVVTKFEAAAKVRAKLVKGLAPHRVLHL